MTDDGLEPAGADELARLARELVAGLDTLTDGATDVILRKTQFQEGRTAVTDRAVREHTRLNLEAVLSRLGAGDRPLDLGHARRNGQERARAGVPLATLMVAYRVGVRYLWQRVVERARERGIGDAALVAAACDLWDAQDELTSTMATSYRDELQLLVLAREEERSALVQALLEGRIIESSTLWEIADVLRIGPAGPYVVVAAQLAEVGRRSLPAVEPTLRGLGIASAWRLTPDAQTGIVCLAGRDQLGSLLQVVRRVATTRVGVSPVYDQLADTAANLRLARIAMTASIPAKDPVTVFDTDALAVAAASAPDVTTRVANGILAGLAELPAADRTLLLDTFEAWLDSDGSTALAGAALYCHQNTVRHRLRRLEKHTGRSLTNPRELTELCLALEIDRRLPRVAGA